MEHIFDWILLCIDGVIYNLVDGVYDIFDFLARVNIFSESSYNEIVERIYIILGVVMLFVLAYTLLRAIINPDELSKSDNSFASFAKNIAISIALIVLMPTIFNVAFSFQNALLNTGTITTLILGNNNLKYTEEYDDGEIEMSPGRMMAINTFTSFFYPDPEYCQIEKGIDTSVREGLEQCKDTIYSDAFLSRGPITLREADKAVKSRRSMLYYAKFSKAVANDEISYTMLISTACGAFLLYVLLNFCFDMALRVIKLMFYQIIAPIPIVCRMIPFGKLKDVFGTWVKQVTSVFFEVFVRIAVMNFGVLLIKIACQTLNSSYFGGTLNFNGTAYNLSWLQFTLARVLIIMGIVMFIRRAPDLISKLFGIDTSGMSLNIREKLRDSGAFAAGAAIQAAGGMAIRNGARAFGNIRNSFQNARNNGNNVAQSLWAARRDIGRGVRSALGGAISGGARAGRRGWTASNFQEARNARNEAVDIATRNRDRRERYRTLHQNDPGGVFGAHVVDALDDFRYWMNDGADQYADERRVYEQIDRYRQNIESKSDEIRDRNKDNNAISQIYHNNYVRNALSSAQAAREYLHQTEGATFDVATAAQQEARIQELMAGTNEDAARRYLEQTLGTAFTSLSGAAQQARIAYFMNITSGANAWRNAVEDDWNQRYGNTQNLDEVRSRVQRLQNMQFASNAIRNIVDAFGNVIGSEAVMEIDGVQYNEAEWDRYVAQAVHALSDYERESSTIIRQAIMNGQDFINEHGDEYGHIDATHLNNVRAEVAANRSRAFTAGMNVNGRTFNTQEEWNSYRTRLEENLEAFDNLVALGLYDAEGNMTARGGVADRIVDIRTNAQSIDQTFNENSALTRDGIPAAANNPTSFGRMDAAGHAISQRYSQITMATEQQSRRQSARGNNNNNNNNSN